ncbi:hypothetical protein [Niabella hibiscisoli]|uniref:hypothetical protein n=1 Tax=Niabella hibiscisoli TaxID=1825928 RepID=UPI001F0E625D|nr:hypothetical protein [Niabella hibiscisoli]MCH5720091.1 hypothetical protein [Niabella hibiscisoli]
MKTFQFKQHNTAKAIIVAIVYLLIVFAVAYIWLGGVNGMAEKVNSIGSAKGAALLSGL